MGYAIVGAGHVGLALAGLGFIETAAGEYRSAERYLAEACDILDIHAAAMALASGAGAVVLLLGVAACAPPPPTTLAPDGGDGCRNSSSVTPKKTRPAQSR